jgi:carboxylate-amine ligase
MTSAQPSFTVGIEEEYLLVDRQTRELVIDPPPGLMADCKAALGKQVSTEFFRCQIEVGTLATANMEEARADLAGLRRTIAACAAEYGIAPIAASVHPFSDWNLQLYTDKERYRLIADDLQGPGRRLVICGLHVHVGIEDEAERFDLFGQVPYFLPHFVALSASSPFWRGEPTGMCSYRLAVQRETPRTGLPPVFSTAADYRRSVDVLVKSGVIKDGTFLWWDLRPSEKYPTLELRVCDACTRIDDSIALAALYRCTLRMLSRLRSQNARWRTYSPFLVEENRWIAQRFGRSAALVDLGKGTTVPMPELVDEWMAMIADDIAWFGCEAEMAQVRRIIAEGTSADRQLAAYRTALAEGASAEEALRAVVDHLVAETVADIGEIAFSGSPAARQGGAEAAART